MDPEHIAAIIKALKAQGAPDEAIHFILQQHYGLKPVAQPGNARLHAEYQSGALDKRMQAATARDQANLADQQEAGADASIHNPLYTAGQAMLAGGANVMQGLPGGEAVEAGARSLVRGQTYRDALGDLRGSTDQIPGGLKAAQRAVGGLPMAALPGGSALSGAIGGAAAGALDADPDQGWKERAFKGAVGAAGGALLGKGTDVAIAGARSALTAEPAANIIARVTERAAAAKQLYLAAYGQARGRAPTRAVLQFLQDPEVAGIVSGLSKLEQNQGLEPHSPEMLHQIYTELTDQGRQLQKSLSSPTAGQVNGKNALLEHIGLKKEKMLNALETPDAAPGGAGASASGSPDPGFRDALELPLFDRQVPQRGYMPGYRAAPRDYAQRSAGIEGVSKGAKAIYTATSKRLPVGARLVENSTPGLQKWADAQPDAIRTAASEGVLGGVKMAASKGVRRGVKAMMKAPGVLRDINDPAQSAIDELVKRALAATIAGAKP